MKLNVKRETTIGLSLLLVLVVILGFVAVRRFMRPNFPPEAAIARAEERRLEGLPEHGSKREADLKPALLTPVDTPNRDSLQALDDPDHWNTAEKKRKKEIPTGAAESSLMACDPPATLTPPVIAKAGKRDHEHPMTYRPNERAPTATDDRYSTVAIEPSVEPRTSGSSRSTVIQVSGGEQGDGARQSLERHEADEHPDPRFQPPHPGPGTLADGMGLVAEFSRHPASREALVTGRPADPAAPDRMRAGDLPPNVPASRYNDDRAFSAPDREARRDDDGVRMRTESPNYTTVPAGYGLGDSPRVGDEAADRMRAQNRLRDDGTYEVQPNDSYWTISERVYGSGAYFRALAEQNRGKAARPDRLPPGLVISTPPVARLEKDFPDLCPRPNHRDSQADHGYMVPAALRNRAAATSMAATAGGGRTYVVQEGDTLSSIARNELGRVSRWAEIYQLNREALGKDYDYLAPGMRLVMPIRDLQPGDRTTQRSDGGDPLVR